MSAVRVCVCFACLSLLACDRSASGGGDLAAQIERVSKEMQLPKASGPQAQAPETTLRVSVTPEGVLLKDSSGAEPNVVFVPIKMLEVPPGPIPALFEPLQKARTGAGEATSYALAVDKRVAYEVVVRVMESAGQAMWSDPSIAYAGEGGETWVRLLTPRMCAAKPLKAAPVAADPTCEVCALLLDQQDAGGACARPRLRWVEGGVQVTALTGERGRGGCAGTVVGEGQASAAKTWHDAVVTAGTCPLAPDKVEGLLDALDAHASLCEHGELVPAPKTTWGEVSGVMERLVATSTLEQITLGVSSAKPVPCDKAFVLSAAR